MKILLSIAKLGFAGGERQIVTLAQGLDRRRFAPFFVLPSRGDFLLDELPADVRVYELGRRWRYADFLLMVAQTARILRQEQPDILFGVEPYAATLLLLAKAVAGVPESGVRAKLVIREGCAWKQYEDDRVSNWFRRWVYPRADRLVANSQGTKRDLVEHFPLRPENVTVIYNLVDTAAVRRLAAEAVEPGVSRNGIPTIVALARFDRHKGIPYLLQACALVRRELPVQLLLIGQGKAREELAALARQLGLGDAVVFLGHQTNPFRWLKHAQVFVHPALYEGFGQVVVEAMALGLPVVATRCPHGPSEAIEDGRSGLLVPPADAPALAAAILRVLRDDGLRETLAREGRRRAEAFAVARGIQQYEDLFSHV